VRESRAEQNRAEQSRAEQNRTEQRDKERLVSVVVEKEGVID